MKRILSCVALVAALMVAAGPAAAQQRDKVVLLLNFYLYSEHAPFFLGVKRGYFAKQGIDLDIQEGRGSVSTVQAVANGTVQFGYADVASVIKAADKGAPVETVGVLLQKSPMAVISQADRNIRKPADLRGKTVALSPGDSLSQVWPLFLEKTGLTASDITIVAGDARTKLNAVINGKSDAMLGYLMDQNMRIEDATKKPAAVMPFSDYGVNLISSCIVVSKATLKSNGDLVRRFMKAATQSVEDAEKDPTAAVDAMLEARPKAGNRATLIRGLELTIPLYHTDATKSLPPFHVSADNFAQSMKMLADYGGVSKAAGDHPKDFYTLDYLPK